MDADKGPRLGKADVLRKHWPKYRRRKDTVGSMCNVKVNIGLTSGEWSIQRDDTKIEDDDRNNDNNWIIVSQRINITNR